MWPLAVQVEGILPSLEVPLGPDDLAEIPAQGDAHVAVALPQDVAGVEVADAPAAECEGEGGHVFHIDTAGKRAGVSGDLAELLPRQVADQVDRVDRQPVQDPASGHLPAKQPVLGVALGDAAGHHACLDGANVAQRTLAHEAVDAPCRWLQPVEERRGPDRSPCRCRLIEPFDIGRRAPRRLFDDAGDSRREQAHTEVGGLVVAHRQQDHVRTTRLGQQCVEGYEGGIVWNLRRRVSLG